MKLYHSGLIVALCMLLLVVSGCTTVDEPVVVDTSAVEVDAATSSITPESVPPQTATVDADSTTIPAESNAPSVSIAASVTTPIVPSTNQPQPSVADPGKSSVEALSTPPAENGPKQPIQVSQEVFTRTFNEVDQVIDTLNKLIQQRNYSAWLEWLSEAYQTYTVSPEQLVIVNNSATLKRNGQVVRNLNDYFMFVVVPSRANLRLDDLVFLSENEVEAIMKVGDRRVTVYRLIKIGDRWKIGLSL